MKVFEDLNAKHEDEHANKEETHANHVIDDSESSPIEYFKFGLIILAISVIAWYLSGYGSGGMDEFLRWFMGVFFMVFASFKLIGYQMFTMMFAGYDIIAMR